jgi:hypothetical protein
MDIKHIILSNGKIFHALDDAADRNWSEGQWLTRNNMRSFDPWK